MNNKKSVALYLDLDGCFSNFCESAYELFDRFDELEGLYSDEVKTDEMKILRAEMVQAIANKKDFWHTLPWTSNGKKLYEYIKDNYDMSKVSVLTAPMSNDPNCCLGKLHWVTHNMPEIKNIIIDDAKYKHIHNVTADVQILIDDRIKNVEQWYHEGGMPILHHNDDINLTIEVLQSLSQNH